MFGNLDELELKSDSMYLKRSILNATYGIHIDVIFFLFFLAVALLTAFSVGISNASGA